MFDHYKQRVKDGTEQTSIMLQALTIINLFTDEEIRIMVQKLSSDFLFAMIDQKLRMEILEEDKNG